MTRFNKGPAISGVTMHRIGIFSGKTENDNAWASMKLNRPLSENAQCCLEACFFTATKIAMNRSAEIVLYVDYYKLDKLLSWNRHYEKIDEMLDQLQTTLITIEKHIKKQNGTDLKIMTTQTIISKRIKIDGVAATKVSSGLSRLQTVKRVKITLSNAFVQMLQNDIAMHYLALVPLILTLKNKESRMLARFCLSHSHDQNVSTKTIMEILGEEWGSRMARKRLARIADDAQRLEAIGIKWDPETKTVNYSRNPHIFFTSPTQSGPIREASRTDPRSILTQSGPICEAFCPSLRDL